MLPFIYSASRTSGGAGIKLRYSTTSPDMADVSPVARFLSTLCFLPWESSGGLIP